METIEVSITDKGIVKENVAIYVIEQVHNIYDVEKDRTGLLKDNTTSLELFNLLGKYRSIAIEKVDTIKIVASATQLKHIDDLIHDIKSEKV